MGFQKLQPENEPKKRIVSKEEKKNLELGKMLIPAKKITASAKTEIYKIVTGMDYPAKRGKPSERGRNFKAAIEFLYLMGNTSDTVNEIKSSLANTYNLPGGEKNLTSTERQIDDVNFYKIVGQQLDKLESDLKQYVDAVENGLLDDKKNIYKNSNICLKGLSRYKASKRQKIM